MHTMPLRANAPGPSTVLEDTAAVRELMRSLPQAPAARNANAVADGTRPYRPSQRPPLLVLQALDDGEATGEVIRVRQSPFVIGRAEGDFRIPFDTQISTRHAELLCHQQGGYYQWRIRDLGSTNGIFVRAAKVTLIQDQQLIIGTHRLQVDLQAATVETRRPTPLATSQWQMPPAGPMPSGSLQLLDLSAGGTRYSVGTGEVECWLGRDPQSCRIALPDSTVNLRHARLYLDELRRWTLENANSLNGVWVRIGDMTLGKGGEFQCGEQRFVFRIL